MWMCLSTVEHTASGGVEGGHKIPGYVRIMRLPSFRRLREETIYKFEEIGKLFEIFSSDHEKALGDGDRPTSTAAARKAPDWDAVLAELMQMTPSPTPESATLEVDEHLIGCVLLEAYSQLHRELEALRHSFHLEE
eukprot:CAMPEP_0176018944 /NCGR_PEP_ID=MMETSP0120_2-20121206/9138_1 /TAXON_ID=160619 /ORGANISM="Kryptoperidinium foliaceum, Strain CCMP 1326" /LENGTH=135 /DNA_ID=CAMNT_0017352009 /DNA_START=24 /DNA_END=431 /DNA_ORIENTATION=+